MVSWGANTVHTYTTSSQSTASSGSMPAPAGGGGGFSFSSSPAPASGGGGSLFGTPAPSSSGFGGGFGSTTPGPAPGGLFGTPTPASGGGFFGNTSSSSGTGLFGSSSPAPSSGGGGLFGSAPSSGGGLFGAPSSGGGLFGDGSSSSSGGGLFGASAPAPFGAQQQQQQPQGPQIPAQAAFQAHQDAQARQMESEFNRKIQEYEAIYNGTMIASEEQSPPFTTVFYNPASSEYQQKVWLVQGNTGSRETRPILDRPHQISKRDWELACLRAPEDYEPIPAVGAESLQARISYQQEQANQAMEQVNILRKMSKRLEERMQEALRDGYAVKHSRLHQERRQRLWRIMHKVELIRCLNIPLQQEEANAWRELSDIKHGAESIAPFTGQISPQQGMPRLVTRDGSQPVDPKQVKYVLEEHRMELKKNIEKVNKDLRDIKLLKERLQS